MNNNIKETHVNFENAVLLKEKGFDVGCNSFYDCNKEYVEDVGNYNSEDQDEHCNHSSAPTTALAIKWIRENFGIHIYTECDCYGEFFYPKIISASNKTWENMDLRDKVIATRHNQDLFEFKSQPEAEQEAITYTLTNLIP